jgi:hypothetical protein
MSNASSKGMVAGRTVTATPGLGERGELPASSRSIAAAESSLAESSPSLPLPALLPVSALHGTGLHIAAGEPAIIVAGPSFAPAAPSFAPAAPSFAPAAPSFAPAAPSPVESAAPPVTETTESPQAEQGAETLGQADADEARRTLERRIRAHLSRGTLSLTLTDNRYTMISVRRENRDGRCFKVRLHHMFVEAGPGIARALARYITNNDRESSRLLGEFIDANQSRVRSRHRRVGAARMVTRGKYHDLQEIYDDLNRRYFGGTIDARITWGQRGGRPRRRNSIKMGSYSVEERLVRIHRSLDRAFVPRFFVEWIVYHEMLHQVHEIKVVNGRRQFHTREFLRDEARFEHYVAARRWERIHLDALLTC